MGLFPGAFTLVVAVTAAVVAGAVLVMERQRSYRLELLYRATMLLTLCGIAATGVAAANESTARVSTVLGCVFGCKYLGLFVGSRMVDALKTAGLESQGPAILPAATLACMAVIAVAHLLVSPEREPLSLSPLLFGMSSESPEKRCQQIAAENGLAQQETEVFALLARSRDVGYICQEPYIARNTANAHRKSIYTKLGIHSQQDLLSLVEGSR